jgi:hypothetical protein
LYTWTRYSAGALLRLEARDDLVADTLSGLLS